MSGPVLAPARAFCEAFGLRCPVLMAPMAGASPVALAAAVSNAGGIGACGVLGMGPDQIRVWVSEFRAGSTGPLQLNTWVPDPDPARDPAKERRVRDFLARWGPEVPADAGDARLVDFEAQMAAMIQARPAIISSIMGLYSAKHVEQMKANGIKWFAVATTVCEALAAEAAGADAIVAQGMEAGGHRGAFKADDAARDLVGLFSLLPAIVDAVRVPVIATGGIADARGAAAAFTLGASAVQLGTGLLRTPEAGIPRVWADALGSCQPEDTVASRAFSGRLGRNVKAAPAVAVVPAPAEEYDEFVAVPVDSPCSLPSVTAQVLEGKPPASCYVVGSVPVEFSDGESEEHFGGVDSQELSSPRSQGSVVPCPPRDTPWDAPGRCQSIKQVRRWSNRTLLANAERPLMTLSDFSQKGDSFVVSRLMSCASTVLHLTIGLVPGGCPDHRAKVLRISAKLLSAGFCALCGYRSYMTAGYEKWSHTLYAMEAVAFFLLLATVSSSDAFRELMQVGIPEMQKTLGSRLQASLKFDLLPIGVYLVILLLCFVVLVQLHPKSIAHPYPISSAIQRLGWAFVLLRLNRSMMILLDLFAVSYAEDPADFESAYEGWAYIAAFAGEISHWTGAAYFHLSTFALLGIFPLLAEVLMGLQDNTDWLLSHLIMNITNCCLALHVLHRAAAVGHQQDSAVVSVNSLQWTLTWQQRHRQHLFVAYMRQSEVGTYVYGIRVTNSLLAKLVPVLVTGGSFALARILALPHESKAELVQQWNHLLQALGVQ
ncbi:unnamed protein product [Symbiodinium microadriaticum]|nr:unnamed protein product [Symbiodinium microadriaticum]